MNQPRTRNAVALFSGADVDLQTFMRDFAKTHDFVLLGFFAIEADALEAALLHAFSMSKNAKLSVIIFDEYNTLHLPIKKLMEFFSALLEAHVEIIFAKDNFRLTRDTIALFLQLLKQSDHVDAKMRSTRIKKSLLQKKRKGAVLGGRKFGSAHHESLVVKQIFSLRKQGKSLQEICELLAAHQIKTTKGKAWHPTTVKRILER